MDINSFRRYFRKDSPRWVILLIDMIIVLLCYYLTNFTVNSFKGRFDVEIMVKKSLFIMAIYYFSFLYFKTYRGIVRQTGLRDAWGILKAVFVAFVVLMFTSFLVRNIFEERAAISLFFTASAVQAQDFNDDSRFEIRLSAFNSDSSIRFAGNGVATNGEETESA